jgi:hypothetical protein
MTTTQHTQRAAAIKSAFTTHEHTNIPTGQSIDIAHRQSVTNRASHHIANRAHPPYLIISGSISPIDPTQATQRQNQTPAARHGAHAICMTSKLVFLGISPMFRTSELLDFDLVNVCQSVTA